ncbi:hypothetical protein Bbelb_140330 [Branchiostoma belcheri]|nr:hypothetical protein Bbelb_140330 [Branchiostoma belcheri]
MQRHLLRMHVKSPDVWSYFRVTDMDKGWSANNVYRVFTAGQDWEPLVMLPRILDYIQDTVNLNGRMFVNMEPCHAVRVRSRSLQLHSGTDTTELSSEELHRHDAADEPEHQAHQQHVKDGRDGLEEGVHHNLPVQQQVRNTRLTFKLW